MYVCVSVYVCISLLISSYLLRDRPNGPMVKSDCARACALYTFAYRTRIIYDMI